MDQRSKGHVGRGSLMPLLRSVVVSLEAGIYWFDAPLHRYKRPSEKALRA